LERGSPRRATRRRSPRACINVSTTPHSQRDRA
jgi:hypothetical protein